MLRERTRILVPSGSRSLTPSSTMLPRTDVGPSLCTDQHAAWHGSTRPLAASSLYFHLFRPLLPDPSDAQSFSISPGRPGGASQLPGSLGLAPAQTLLPIRPASIPPAHGLICTWRHSVTVTQNSGSCPHRMHAPPSCPLFR